MSNFEELVIKKLDRLEKHVENLTERVTSLEEDTKVLRSSVTIIESKVSRDIPALFEVYDIDKQEQRSQRTEINSLNLLTEEHDIKISALEATTKEHSKKLKNLVS